MIFQTIPITFYLDPVLGSDSHDGLTSSTAWKTFAHAIPFVCINYVFQVGLNGAPWSGQIRVVGDPVTGCATVNENIVLTPYLCTGFQNHLGVLWISGDSSDNTKITLNSLTGNTISAGFCNVPWVLDNVTLTSAHANAILADMNTTIYCHGVNYGACPNGSHKVVEWNSTVEEIIIPFKISGNALAHVIAVRGACAMSNSNACTLGGGLNFVGGFAQVADPSSIVDYSQVTWTGTQSGPKTSISNGGIVINASALPGV